jgi:hypothetical protein
VLPVVFPSRLPLNGKRQTLAPFVILQQAGLRAFPKSSMRNSFLSPVTEIITERKGTIDRYIGDCIMAFLERTARRSRACQKCGASRAGDAP